MSHESTMPTYFQRPYYYFILTHYFFLFKDVICKIQEILDRNSPDIFDVPKSSSEDDSSDDEEDEIPTHDNINYRIANDEFELLEQYKAKKYCPVLDRSKSSILSGEDENGKTWEIIVGLVISRGSDLPSGKNQAKYTDFRGRFEGVWFYTYHCKIFPTIFILVLIEAALKNAKVGCERFFSLSGYVSAPCRTRLGVRTYERIELLAVILPKVYIYKEWVTKE